MSLRAFNCKDLRGLRGISTALVTLRHKVDKSSHVQVVSPVHLPFKAHTH